MGITKNKKLVKDIYFGDLPEDIRIKLMDIHKLIVNTCNDVIKDHNYDDIRDTAWAKSMLEEFLTMPIDRQNVGSVRIYKNGKRYSCMIQITGHVTNNREDIDHELFHDFIRNVHVSIRPKIRRKYDLALTCESEHGEHFEGFDVWTKPKVAKELWEHFNDIKIKTIKEFNESYYNEAVFKKRNTNTDEIIILTINQLPDGLQKEIMKVNHDIIQCIIKNAKNEKYNILYNNKSFNDIIKHLSGKTAAKSDIGFTTIKCFDNDTFEGSIMVTPDPLQNIGTINSKDCNKLLKELMLDVLTNFNRDYGEDNPTKELCLSNKGSSTYFEFRLKPEYAEKLINYIKPEEGIKMENNYVESNQEYNVEMTESEAKRTLKTLSQNIINDIKNKPDFRINQYTANIYANIITKNLLPIWADGFRKFSIILDTYQSFYTLEFKIPTVSQDFVSRFINGRENLDGFLHRSGEIKIKMSPRIFHSMTSPDDAFNFFKAAIKYYNSDVAKYGEKLMSEVMKLNHEMKHLITHSKLSVIVTCPMQLLFVFDNVSMANKNTFKISNDDIKTINQFVKNIYTKYASPEKEKKQIIDDLKNIVRSLNEFCEYSDNIKQILSLPETVSQLYEHKFDIIMKESREEWIYEQINHDWHRCQNNPEIKYMQEKFGVKKLKKIPTDLIAYITIETENIKTTNDKMMIASYCLGKLEIVEWYIELLATGSKKYIVPHTKPYLETVRTNLLACYKNIMNVKINNSSDKPLININYPKGYEG